MPYIRGLELLEGKADVPETVGSAAASAPHERFRSQSYFSGLDGLRAIAVIAVIWQHTAGFTGSQSILSRGYLGVDLFFAISGLLITTLLLREWSRRGGISLKRFYVRRVLRIFPIYYVVLAVYLALVLATRRGTPDGQAFLGNLSYFATYTSNWFVERGESVTFYFAWSLATEEQFYLVWPPVLALALGASMRRPTIRWWIAPLIVIVLGLVMHVVGVILDNVVLSSIEPAILLGAAAAVLLHSRTGFGLLYAPLGHRLSAPLLALIAALAVHFGAHDVVVGCLFVALVTSIAMREDTALHPLLTPKPVALVGAISYGIYLMHMLAANAARPVLAHRFGVDVFLAATAIVMVMAYVSFRLFETPVREWGRRAFDRRERRDGRDDRSDG